MSGSNSMPRVGSWRRKNASWSESHVNGFGPPRPRPTRRRRPPSTTAPSSPPWCGALLGVAGPVRCDPQVTDRRQRLPLVLERRDAPGRGPLGTVQHEVEQLVGELGAVAEPLDGTSASRSLGIAPAAWPRAQKAGTAARSIGGSSAIPSSVACQAWSNTSMCHRASFGRAIRERSRSAIVPAPRRLMVRVTSAWNQSRTRSTPRSPAARGRRGRRGRPWRPSHRRRRPSRCRCRGGRRRRR